MTDEHQVCHRVKCRRGAVLILAVSATWPVSGQVPCATDEFSVFSCKSLPTNSDGYVALCATSDLSRDRGQLRLRYRADGFKAPSLWSIDMATQRKDQAYFYTEFPKGFTSALAFTGSNGRRMPLFQTSSVYGYNGAGLVERGTDGPHWLATCDRRSITRNADTALPVTYFDPRPLGFSVSEEDVVFIGSESGPELKMNK